ncbi:helix-turn-helix transcriptional regulator [Yersinia pseudotuberculosis]|uniref:helix-turn-helix transcriptional regulator n=1 Tax=Yersinia pseudotuberculosis TaxID=633 RepID=UPI0038B44382
MLSSNIRIIRAKEVMQMVGYKARSSFDYFYQNPENEFPAPVPVTKSRLGWIDEEVEDWIKKRMDKRKDITVL